MEVFMFSQLYYNHPYPPLIQVTDRNVAPKYFMDE